MQQLHLTTSSDPADSTALAGTFADASHYDTLLTPANGDMYITKPDGQPLLVVLRKVADSGRPESPTLDRRDRPDHYGGV